MVRAPSAKGVMTTSYSGPGFDNVKGAVQGQKKLTSLKHIRHKIVTLPASQILRALFSLVPLAIDQSAGITPISILAA
jgi:hypothetical protein